MKTSGKHISLQVRDFCALVRTWKTFVCGTKGWINCFCISISAQTELWHGAWCCNAAIYCQLTMPCKNFKLRWERAKCFGVVSRDNNVGRLLNSTGMHREEQMWLINQGHSKRFSHYTQQKEQILQINCVHDKNLCARSFLIWEYCHLVGRSSNGLYSVWLGCVLQKLHLRHVLPSQSSTHHNGRILFWQ